MLISACKSYFSCCLPTTEENPEGKNQSSKNFNNEGTHLPEAVEVPQAELFIPSPTANFQEETGTLQSEPSIVSQNSDEDGDAPLTQEDGEGCVLVMPSILDRV